MLTTQRKMGQADPARLDTTALRGRRFHWVVMQGRTTHKRDSMNARLVKKGGYLTPFSGELEINEKVKKKLVKAFENAFSFTDV